MVDLRWDNLWHFEVDLGIMLHTQVWMYS